MSADELQAARSEAERLEKAGYFLKAVAALKKLARAELPAEDLHDTHLRLARVYRAMNLAEEADREILAVAMHWNEEGRTMEARNLLVSNADLLPGGIAMLGDLPADGEAGRTALDELLRCLTNVRRPAPQPPEDTPIDELLPSPKLPSPKGSSSRGGGSRNSPPGVPLPQPALDTRDARGASRLDQAIDRLGESVQRNPADVGSRLKLADLLLKAGRTPDGIAHLVLGAVHHEKAGEPHEALKIYKQILKITPERRELHNRLGDIYTHLGLLAEAALEYKKAEKPL